MSYTGQPANLHRANAQIERNVSWWNLEARPLLSKFLPFATVLRNPWQGLSFSRSRPVSVALVGPARRSWKCIRRPSTLPVSHGTGGSPFPSVRATRSNTVSVRLGNVKLGLNSEKRKATSYPWSPNREKNFGRRNGLHSFHCMHYALNVSRAFRCPPPFCAQTFDELTTGLRQDPLDLSFWSFSTFLHHGIEEVERHLLWKFYIKFRRKSWSNVPPKLLACIGFLYKVVHKIGRLRKFNRSRESEFNFLTAWTISMKFGTLV